MGVTTTTTARRGPRLTPVDIGADAGNFIGMDLSAPAITYTALGNTTLTGNRTLTATITDVTGVPTSGVLAAAHLLQEGRRRHLVLVAGLRSPSGSGTSGTWDFTIVAADMGGVTTADVIYYYVIAAGHARPRTSAPTLAARWPPTSTR